MITRRTALIGTAMATLMAVVPAIADESANPTLNALDLPDQTVTLERVQATLVPPPAVMEHDRVATGAPKVVEFTMTIEEKTIRERSSMP